MRFFRRRVYLEKACTCPASIPTHMRLAQIESDIADMQIQRLDSTTARLLHKRMESIEENLSNHETELAQVYAQMHPEETPIDFLVRLQREMRLAHVRKD